MSKYYKAEDVIRAIESADLMLTMWQEQFVINTLKDLPTIEVSEVKALPYTGKQSCDTCKHYKLMCDLFSEICKYKPTTEQSSMVEERIEE